MRTLAMTGMVTALVMSLIIAGSLCGMSELRTKRDEWCDVTIRETPPSALMSAGTRSSAITAQAPASSAMRAYGCRSGRPRTCLLGVMERYLLDINDVHDDATLADGQVVRQRSHTKNDYGNGCGNECTLSICANPDFTCGT